MFNNKGLLTLVLAAFALFASSPAFSAGLEKSVFWSGHYAGIAGAAQSSVTGPESLYWNPAGLAGSQGLQVSGDFSPTFSQFSGPFVGNTASGSIGTTVNSSTSFSPVGAGFVSYGLTPQWGVGVGYYVSAGTRADYDSVPNDLTAGTWNAPDNADLTITELSLGTGYEILPGLKFGAAYRVAFVGGDLNEQVVIPSEVLSVQTSGISQTAWGGFKVGLQYAPKDANWGVGVTYRNQIRFNANGSTNVLTANKGSLSPTTVNSNEQTLVQATLPQALNIAAHYVFNPNWTGFLGYTFTNYAVDQTLGVSGVTTPLGLGPNAFSVPLGWTNMHNIRAALEYDGIQDWAIRGGYVWTSQVTPMANALPIVASPGTGNTVVAGAGHKITQNLEGDAAFEYSWDSGSVPTSPAPASSTAAGDYAAHAFALHLGLTYTM